MMRAAGLVLTAAWFLAVMTAAGPAPRQVQAAAQDEVSGPVGAIRRAEMQRHFGQASTIYDAVIRGDLATAREAALALWSIPAPAGLADAGAPFLEAIRMQGRQVSEASTVAEASRATADMLATCGNCHRAVSVWVVPNLEELPEVGGIVGHMLQHERAVSQMAEGLVAPSTTRWDAGADALLAAPLDPGDLPPDSGLTPEIRVAESRVHRMAEAAVAAEDNDARVAAFADVLATCSTCHSLHSRVWGPGNRR